MKTRSRGARPIDRTDPVLVALPTTAGTGSEVGRSSVISDDADAHQEDHLLAEASRQGGVRRPRAHARPARPRSPPRPAWTPSRIAWKPISPRATTRSATASRSKACGWRRGLANGGQEAARSRGARRHADVLDDGRDRVSEGPRRDPFLRARARHRGRHASRARQRRHDRPRAQASTVDGRAGALPGDGRRRSACKEATPRRRSSSGSAGSRRDRDPAQPRPSAGAGKDSFAKLIELAIEDSCHQNNPRPCTRGQISSRSSPRRSDGAPPLQDRRFGVFFPRRPASARSSRARRCTTSSSRSRTGCMSRGRARCT